MEELHGAWKLTTQVNGAANSMSLFQYSITQNYCTGAYIFAYLKRLGKAITSCLQRRPTGTQARIKGRASVLSLCCVSHQSTEITDKAKLQEMINDACQTESCWTKSIPSEWTSFYREPRLRSRTDRALVFKEIHLESRLRHKGA
jgi:hypothetical protein